MKFILQIKAWQLFLIWMILSIISFISYIGSFLLIFTFFLWIYSIGTLMNSFIPQNSRPTLPYFQFSCVLVMVIMAVFSLNDIYNIVHLPNWLVLPIMLYCFLSIFYVMMFAARMLKSAREGELVNRSDSFGTFLYIIFAPWGIWTIQKEIRGVFADKVAIAPRLSSK